MPVTLVALSYSKDNYVDGSYVNTNNVQSFLETSVFIATYAGTNLFDPVSPATPIFNIALNSPIDRMARTFQATAGVSYQIRFYCNHPGPTITFQLIATNGPAILDPPTDQTIFPAGSALFTVLATGFSPLSYQWRFNGVDLPGQTYAMLPFNNADTNVAGAYSVVVSNSSGSVVVGPANLVINPNPVKPFLTPVAPTASNSFAFNLAGESGRYYRIESSTDLINWQPEKSFHTNTVVWDFYGPYDQSPGSVVYNTNSTISLSVPATNGCKFYRATLYAPANEICNNNLKEIRFAKQLWIRDQPGFPERFLSPGGADLAPYVPNYPELYCPLDVFQQFFVSYTVGDMTDDPICKVRYEHALEEPR
jgi:hypothetical protein